MLGKGILLTTYDVVRNSSLCIRGDYGIQDKRSEDSITWDYMILDEGHLIKNNNTYRAQSVFEIPSAHRIILTGLPIQNNLQELWALFNFCCPGLLGDKTWFKEKYEYPILCGNDKKACNKDKKIGSAVAKKLRDHIQPYFLRRLKSEVSREDDDTNAPKLPKKNEITVWLKLTKYQQQLYKCFLKDERARSTFGASPLAALTVLKKICGHPLLLLKTAAGNFLDEMDPILSQAGHIVAEQLAMGFAELTNINIQRKRDNISCKINFILALLDNLIPQDHNVLIFSQTCKMLNLIQESLKKKGHKYRRIDGTTEARERIKIVNNFQEGVGARVLLLTPQVGVGLTLTKADRVILVNPAWNPSTDNQSIGRAYGIGQTTDVLVYRLVTCGTVEENIYRKLVCKEGLLKSVTENKEHRYFSQQDLQELFSLPEQGFSVSQTRQQLREENDSQHNMDESLTQHIKFLESQGIVGVSHHSLLFSETAPLPAELEEEEAVRAKDVKVDRIKDDLKSRISHLNKILANKRDVSKLSDRGEKIRKQIASLELELHNISGGEKKGNH